MKTIIKPITNLPIKNFLTQEEYYLSSLTHPFSQKDIDQLITICNQSLIYNILFKKKLKGIPYQKKDVIKFQKWANKGWKNQVWFAFIVRNKQGNIINCLDIKSSSKTAEIGYWADSNYPGNMTSAVKEMIKLAKNSNFKSLFAITPPKNFKSQKLLKKVGFKYSTRVIYKDTLCHKYILKLK